MVYTSTLVCNLIPFKRNDDLCFLFCKTVAIIQPIKLGKQVKDKDTLSQDWVNNVISIYIIVIILLLIQLYISEMTTNEPMMNLVLSTPKEDTLKYLQLLNHLHHHWMVYGILLHVFVLLKKVYAFKTLFNFIPSQFKIQSSYSFGHTITTNNSDTSEYSEDNRIPDLCIIPPNAENVKTRVDNNINFKPVPFGLTLSPASFQQGIAATHPDSPMVE